MTLAEVLHLLIEDLLVEARHRHPVGSSALRGATDGLEACRDAEPTAMMDVLIDAGLGRVRAPRDDGNWSQYLVEYRREVRFVAAVMSCALEYHGLPALVTVTVEARLRYGSIVGYVSAR